MIRKQKICKKLSLLNVSIAKKKGRAKPINQSVRTNFSERIIYGLGKPIRQRIYFFSKKNSILISLERNGSEIGKLNIKIQRNGDYSQASFSDAFIKKIMREKGLYTQIVAEALDILTKKKVNSVRFEATDGFNALKRMGFESRNQFGDRIYWKELNP
ncbi:MAG: hypothetical protein PHP82_00905 [Candidatus ainarchaeum sp.]|nr:hypothetical protein [Candidatus ainarchaeum sp.]